MRYAGRRGCGVAFSEVWGEVWEEAFRMLARGGVSLRVTDRVGAAADASEREASV